MREIIRYFTSDTVKLDHPYNRFDKIKTEEGSKTFAMQKFEIDPESKKKREGTWEKMMTTWRISQYFTSFISLKQQQFNDAYGIADNKDAMMAKVDVNLEGLKSSSSTTQRYIVSQSSTPLWIFLSR